MTDPNRIGKAVVDASTGQETPKTLWVARRTRLEQTAWVGLFKRREGIAVGETWEICEDRAKAYLGLTSYEPLPQNVSIEEVDVS